MAAPAGDSLSVFVARLAAFSSSKAAARTIRYACYDLLELPELLLATEAELDVAVEYLTDARQVLHRFLALASLSVTNPSDSEALSRDQLFHMLETRLPGPVAGTDQHLRYAILAVRLLLDLVDCCHSVLLNMMSVPYADPQWAIMLGQAHTFLDSMRALGRLATQHSDIAVAQLTRRTPITVLVALIRLGDN